MLKFSLGYQPIEVALQVAKAGYSLFTMRIRMRMMGEKKVEVVQYRKR